MGVYKPWRVGGGGSFPTYPTPFTQCTQQFCLPSSPLNPISMAHFNQNIIPYSSIDTSGNFGICPDSNTIKPFNDPLVIRLQNLTIDPSNSALASHLTQGDCDPKPTLPVYPGEVQNNQFQPQFSNFFGWNGSSVTGMEFKSPTVALAPSRGKNIFCLPLRIRILTDDKQVHSAAWMADISLMCPIQ